MADVTGAAHDPVRAKRTRVAGAVTIAGRLGYGLFAAALALFTVGFATRFTPGLATATVVCLVAGCVVLAPAIVLGYAVRSAERHDRELGR